MAVHKDCYAPIGLIQQGGPRRRETLQGTWGITYSRHHLYDPEHKRKFPKRIHFGEHRVGWIQSEIDE